MMRKKNITLNGKNATVPEHPPRAMRSSCFWQRRIEVFGSEDSRRFKRKLYIVYEDEHIYRSISHLECCPRKRKRRTDESLVEYPDRLSAGFRQIKERRTSACFRPSVCNRLDQHKAASWQLDVPTGTADHVRKSSGSESGENIMSASVGGRKKAEARIEGWLTKK